VTQMLTLPCHPQHVDWRTRFHTMLPTRTEKRTIDMRTSSLIVGCLHVIVNASMPHLRGVKEEDRECAHGPGTRHKHERRRRVRLRCADAGGCDHRETLPEAQYSGGSSSSSVRSPCKLGLLSCQAHCCLKHTEPRLTWSARMAPPLSTRPAAMGVLRPSSSTANPATTKPGTSVQRG